MDFFLDITNSKIYLCHKKMKNTTQNIDSMLAETKIGNNGVVSILNLPSVILLGIIIISLFGLVIILG
jgi:hypothetical protein